MALAAAICLSPRFTIPVHIGRSFDLRVEDFVLLVLAPMWRVRGGLDAVRRNRIAQAFALYLAVALVSTLANVLGFGLQPVRAAAFWGKNVEFMLIFALAATWARGPRQREWLIWALLALGLANFGWVVVQIALHSHHALFAVQPRGGWPHESYGPGLIGEISPLATGSFFLIQAFLWFTLFAARRRLRHYLGATATLLAMVMAESRVSYIGSVLGAGVVAVAFRRFWVLMASFLAAFVLSNAVLISIGDPDVARVTGVYFIEQSFLYRVHAVWGPVADKYIGTTNHQPTTEQPTSYGLDVAPPPPSAQSRKPPAAVQVLIGYGNGSMGYAPGLPTEAHNHFLRVFLESGIAGLAAFVALIISLALHLWPRIRRRPRDDIDSVIAVALAAILAAFLLGSLLQDMFFPVVPNELFWLLGGLSVAPLLEPAEGQGRAPTP